MVSRESREVCVAWRCLQRVAHGDDHSDGDAPHSDQLGLLRVRELAHFSRQHVRRHTAAERVVAAAAHAEVKAEADADGSEDGGEHAASGGPVPLEARGSVVGGRWSGLEGRTV